MPTTLINLLFAFALPAIFGYSFLKMIFPRQFFSHPIEMAILALTLGMGGLSLAMLYLSLLDIPFIFLHVFLILSTTSLIFWNLSIKKRANQKKTLFLYECEKKNSLEWVFLGLIIVIATLVFLRAILGPLAAWDSWAIYGFKAKAFYIHKTIPAQFLQDQTKFFMNPDYPLHIPLLEAWIYICINRWNDQWVQIISPVYFVSLLVLFHYNLKLYIRRKHSLFMTSLLATIPFIIFSGGNGLADLPFTVYYFISIVFLMRAFPDIDAKLLLISSISSGLAAWTKNEGLAISMTNVFILFLMIIFSKKLNKKTFLLLLKYIFIIFLVAGPWIWVKNSLTLANRVVNTDTLTIANFYHNLDRLPLILKFMTNEFLLLTQWSLFWIFSLPFIALNIKKIIKNPQLLTLLLSVLFFLFFCILTYVVTPFGIRWHLETSLNRLLADVVPLILFIDALLIFSQD